MTKKTAVALLALAALTFLPSASLRAQSAPSVRELVPASAPAGARVLVSGRGLADPSIAVAFGSVSAAVVQRNDRYVEVVVPSSAATGNVRVTVGATLIRELPFTVSTEPRYIVSTLAGGKKTNNQIFKHPNGAAVVLPDGNVAVADEQHDQIQLVTPAGVVSLLAGGKKGSKDGKGAAAELNAPRDLTFDPVNRVLYVSDSGNSSIRRVTLDGTVTTVAGTGKQGYKDGIGSVAQFKDPHGLTVASDGALYVADTKNNRIRKVLPDGTVTTFAGTGAKGDKVVDGALLSATFNEPKGIVADGTTLYVADTKNNAIRKIAGGQVTTVIGFPRTGDDDDPDDGLDGKPGVLNRPSGIDLDEAGNLIVSDSENDFIRKIKLTTTPPTMITIAGTGKNGEVDGDGTIAQFKDPIGLSVAGAIYVADEDNDSVRRICPEVKATGLVSLTGGVSAGTEVRILGSGFVPGGTTVKIGNTVATDVTWISASELAVKLPANVTGGAIVVTISACGGTTAPTSFVVDNAPPTLTITNGGAPLVTGALFKTPVTPLLTAADDTDSAPRIFATLNTTAFTSGTAITADGIYTLVAHAQDSAGNTSAEQTVTFTIDTTPPVVQVLERGVAFPVGALLNRPVEIDAKITDLTTTSYQATIDGAPYVLKQPYGEQGTHNFSITVTDALGWPTSKGPFAFTIDIIGPALTITSHTEGQIVTAKDVIIKGESDDAVTVKVNGANAVVDPATKTFTIALTLLEGSNTINVSGTDAAGNPGTFSRKIVLDSRAPALTIAAVVSCTKSDSLDLHGTVDDPHVDKIVVKLGDVSTNATITGPTWAATVALGLEGRKSILVEATDTVGHSSTEQATLTFDRTAPAIEITEGGAPLTRTIFNRSVTPFVRATDADANTAVTATLDGAAYTSGTAIAGERAHTLQVKAKDCAGNEFTREVTFTIDLTAPRFLTFSPASGSKVTQVPTALTGTVDVDAVEVRVVGEGVTTPASNGAFTLPEPGFSDGVNERTLELVDAAGNIGHASYILGIKTTKPLVDVIEGGASMVEGALYTRAVTPEIRVFENAVTATATLDSAPFTSGTTITATGPHTIVATATDSAFGQTNAITRHFTIDRTGPVVVIVSPASGATFDVDRTDVRVTAGDAVNVSVNGIAAAKQSDSSWIAASVPLDFGETVLAAIAHDAAGNSGSASITVTRGSAGPALVLTFPPDNYVTNRPKLDVSGRVLRPNSTVAVTVPPAAAASVVTDPSGAFRLTGADLTEGEWTVTATATEGGKSTSVQARVIADFTPPRVRILESNSDLEDGAGYATRAVISGAAIDKNQSVAFTLTIDGTPVTSPVTITAQGGHSVILVARDAAGNESRLERTFSIGTTSIGGCHLEAFDPPDQSIIAAQKVELVGRSGGAAGVKVNGIAAKMSNGSFCATVELPQEGPNTVTIACTSAEGTPLGDPVTITLVRVTNEPSVSITLPVEDYVTADGTLTVSGTLGNGAVSVDVNGKPAIVTGSTWSVAAVRLTDGVNVLVARAKNVAGRMAIASRRVTYIADAPAISISSPVPGFVSGAATTDVSGTFSNVDPTSLATPGFAGSVQPTSWSDTTGKFIARNVPLQSGDNTIVVTGRDRTGRLARAEVAVRYLSTAPVITITEPADGDYFAASQGATFRVSGTFRADAGSTVDVNGVEATVDATAKTFTADISFSTLPSGMTPVVARVSQPAGGDGAFDSLRVYKLTDAPKVLETFPAANAVEVDPGVVVLALFSSPMDRDSTLGAFRLENASGAPVNGKALLDKDVLTFAPAATLTPGERYTIKVANTAKDLAGQPLAAAVENSFVASTSAPAAAPTLITASGRTCEQLIEVKGTTIPGARVRLDYGQIYFTTTASAAGAFSYKVPLSGQAGYHVIRVRTIGADGTLSAAAELKLNFDCNGPTVLRASYDRNVNQLTIVFSTDIEAASLTTGASGSVQLALADNRVVGGTIAVSGANVTVTPAENLGASTFTLTVSRDVADKQGRKLQSVHTQLFAIGDDGDQLKPGEGFISGEVYDATTGRPLAGADVSIEVPTAAFSRRVGALSTAATQSVATTSDLRGRYAKALPEGAHTIRASANGYTTVWRQIIVPAGAGVIPIDIRLTRRGDAKSAGTGALSIVHGGTSTVTRRAELTIPAGAVTSGAAVTLTSTGAQSLAGLLPLGWSPLASAEIVSNAATLGASILAFDVPQADITSAAQVLTAVRYDESRDEWRVLVPAVNVTNGKASFDAPTPGAYALVYGDRRPGLAAPAQSITGAPLAGVVDACANGSCPAMAAKSFPLAPDTVLPSGSTVATLNIDGTTAHVFPSGTAVQAYIDEELRLSDGGRELPAPFATDLLLYRDLAGNDGIAAFNLAPSPRAAEVSLEVGFDHIRILPYPGRLDRGTLIGPEGGRVPADEKVAVEIPTGATQDALRATASSLADPNSLGPIAGYTIVGGFQLSLERANAPAPADVDGDGVIDPVAGIELSRPARATFTVDATKLPAGTPQLILAELLDPTPFHNRIFRLAAEMTSLDGGRWTTKAIDRNVLPVDGVIREGRYVLLAANAPIAFARGVVRFATGVAVRDARVSTAGLGVSELSRVSGIFNVPVAATPAAPFTLVPRTVAVGDGATYTHASSPAAGTVVNVGDLTIVAQPPHVTATLPANNATNVSLTTSVEATIAPGIDPASIDAASITVIDATNGTTVTGTAVANGTLGVRWTLPAGDTLQQGRRYVAAVASTVRGSNGTPLEQAYTFSFTTAAVVTNEEVHPERIHITIPDANGVSKITATAGALKAGWLAIPVRREHDFLTRYSVTASGDGSFSLTIGTTARDKVSISDLIDLRVLNNNGALVAIVPLTPFVSEDGKTFVAPAHTAVSFTSIDGYGIDIPAGAFDTATAVTLAPTAPTAFAAVPNLSHEFIFGGTVNVQFAGRAKVPLQLTIPVAPGTDLTREAFLAVLGQSMRGPRIMAVDTLTVVNGKFTTTPPTANAQRVRANDLYRGNGAKDLLQKVIEAGMYAAAMMHPDRGTLAWSFMNTGATVAELVEDTLFSLYVGSRYVAESRGVVAFPVPANTRFVVTATDPATSLKLFEETYNGIPVGAPGTGTAIAAPDTDFNGPHPVFATPFRVETASAPPVGVTLNAIKDITLTLSNAGQLTISGTLTADIQVTALDVRTGERRGRAPLPLQLPNTKPGDEIMLIIDEKDVDPSAVVSIVFNEPIDVGAAASEDEIDTFLKTIIKLDRATNTGDPGTDLLKSALLRLDSSGRRVTVLLPSLLEAGAKFRLTVEKDIQDRSGNGLTLGQAGEKNTSGGVTPIGPTPTPMEIWFTTRGPQGTFAQFDIRQSASSQSGSVREIAQYDNLLFVAAVDGGVLAYDVSDPAALDNAASTTPLPIAYSSGGVTEYWSVYVDHHGRVFSTGMANMFGAIRTWRVEDFVKARNGAVAGCAQHVVCNQMGGAITSQNPGTAYGVGLPSAVVADDRVEGIPRKARFVVGDAEPEEMDAATFFGAYCGGAPADAGDGYHQKCTATLPAAGSNYRLQRITIENLTLGLRWSEDAIGAAPATMTNVIAAPNDRMRVTRNLTTYAVINILGYGIAVYDVNAIESNEVTTAPTIPTAREQVALRANAESSLQPAGIQYVGNLAFSPESHILATGDSSVKVYTLDTRKGAVEFVVTPPAQIALSGKMILTGGVSPRFDALTQALKDSGIDRPFVRFSTGALYHNPNTNKDYLLIAALDYGLIIAEVGAVPLTADSFADVIVIKDAAWAVRVIDNTNMAAVVDGTGRVLIVDLSRIDERDVATGANLFPTAAKALSTNSQDPRILWKSEQPIAIGNIAPVVDPDTGILIGADLLGKRVRLASVLDPKLKITADIGAPTGPKEVGTVVPLGIEPPAGVLQCDAAADPNCRASLGVFRIEARLPGSMTESMAGQLSVAVESERLPGADAPQTPQPFPKAHLRFKKRDGNVDSRSTTDFNLKRTLDFAASAVPELRYQKGWNRLATDWVVAVADVRAAKDYTWAAGADKEAVGCYSCDRPSYLSASGSNARELFTAGRFLFVHPEFNTSGAYGFMAENHRLEKRVGTFMADLVRPSDGASDVDKVAAKNLPTAGAMSQSVVSVNTAEVTRDAVDLTIKGRGLDFVFDRHYSSAITHLGPLGRNYDSALFARVHQLPNGDVVYYDGTGRRDVFTGGSTPPDGVFLDMRLDGNGNVIVQYPDNTRLYFDQYGRLVKITDRNMTKVDGSDGNLMTFAYDSADHLTDIVDPTQRPVHIDYYTDSTSGGFEGAIQKVTDFDNRIVTYRYANGCLTNVDGPDPASAFSAAPSTSYGWGPAGSNGTKNQLYRSGQMSSEKDGLSRTVWSVGYDPTYAWSAKTLTTGGGTWTFTLANDKTNVLDPNSHSTDYMRNSDGTVASMIEPGGASTTYTYDASRLGSVTRPEGDKTVYGYSAAAGGDRRPMGNITTITQHPRPSSPEAGASLTRTTTIQYGTASQTTSIVNSDGAATTIVRDERGNPKTITDAANVTMTTVYDEYGRLKTTTDPRTGTATYGYYPGAKSGYLNTVQTTAGSLTYTADSRGNVTQLADGSGATIYGINQLDQLESETRGTAQTKLIHDATGEVTSKQILAGVDASGNPVFRQMTMGVDEVGRLRTKTDDGQSMTLGYDPAGNLQTVTRTGKPPATFGYDARDRMTTETVGTKTTTYGYDDNGALRSITNGRLQTTTLTVSGFGQSVGDVDPTGIATVTSTDAAGRPVDTRVLKTLPGGRTMVLRWNKMEYDALGRTRRDIQKLFANPLELPSDGSDPVGATDVVRQTIYDDEARKITTIDPRGNATTTEMNDLGQVIKVTDAAGNSIAYKYDANGNTIGETMTEVDGRGHAEVSATKFEYDDKDRLVSKIDVTNPELPLETRYRYDLQGNLSATTDAEGHTTTFGYDKRRRMTSKRLPEGGETTYGYDDNDRLQSVTDANRNTTTFTYDADGNLVTERRQDGATRTYVYDENFNPKTVTDANGTVVAFGYDAEDRLIQKRISRGSRVGGVSEINYSRDDLGRMTTITTDQAVSTSFTYDSLDRQLTESLRIGSGPTRTVSRAYDAAGNVVDLTYPSGLHLTMLVDPLNRLAAIRDAANAAVPLAAYGDIGSRQTSKTVASGVSEQWNYDLNHRLSGITDSKLATTLRDVHYERSRSGDKLAMMRPDLGLATRYTYSKNRWLVREAHDLPLVGDDPQPMFAIDYDFDDVLNARSTMRTVNSISGTTTSTVTHSINQRNQYTTAGPESLTYDRNGNLTARQGLDLQYDFENRLAVATVGNGIVIENLYDGMGRKVREKITSGGNVQKTTDYVLAGDQVKEEYVNDVLARRYVHGRDVDEIVRADVGSTAVYPLQDELGNVERLTSAAGDTLERYEYDGYGSFRVFDALGVSRSTSSLGWKWLFQGRERNEVFGAYDFRARTLWPDLGRFGQEDPATAHVDVSPYEAFLASPVNLTDPSGKYEEDVHHFLSIFVARAVGFDWLESNRIGYETGLLDFDPRDAMYGGRNFASWEQWHFASPARLNEMRRAIMATSTIDNRQVGEFLHSNQDSYSHQSNPHYREFGANFLLQSHAGHGATGHKPDQTWRRPGLAMMMAMDTYIQLRDFCEHFGQCATDKREPFEGRVRTKIAAFIQYEPETFTDEYYGFYPAATVRDYTLKIKILDRSWEIAAYERAPREAAYRAYLDRRAAAEQQAKAREQLMREPKW